MLLEWTLDIERYMIVELFWLLVRFEFKLENLQQFKYLYNLMFLFGFAKI